MHVVCADLVFEDEVNASDVHLVHLAFLCFLCFLCVIISTRSNALAFGFQLDFVFVENVLSKVAAHVGLVVAKETGEVLGSSVDGHVPTQVTLHAEALAANRALVIGREMRLFVSV
jgi:hypothetical protein